MAAKGTAEIVDLPDLMQRAFTVDKPNSVWVAHITYVLTWAGAAQALDYLSPVEYERRFKETASAS